MTLTIFFPKHYRTSQVNNWLVEHWGSFMPGLYVSVHLRYFNHTLNRWTERII